MNRQLDGVRFCIADGILAVFAGLYNRELIVNRHDPLGMIVHWSSFKGALASHFWRFHGLVTLTDRNVRTRGFELVQRESVFADCHARRLYMMGSLAHDRISPHDS